MSRKYDFKIIALKPIAGCDKDRLKILTAGEFYFFYNNYSIDENDRITKKEIVPEDFFFNDKELHVNISAIVGKNGSGKSTVIELLFMALNNLACQQPLSQKLIYVNNIYVDIYFHSDSYYKIEARDKVKVYKYNRNTRSAEPMHDFELKDFFYTIIVNYSHYAYNDTDLSFNKNWLFRLFHKNDGYQTPVVLNPYRRQGNININTENDLVKSRLIANLLKGDEDGYDFKQLTPQLKATDLILKLKSDFRNKVLWEEEIKGQEKRKEITFLDLKINHKKALQALNLYFKFRYRTLKSEDFELATDYVIYKMVSIALKYDDYDGFFLKGQFNFDEERLKEFAKELYDDTSHITFKLRQTLNFLNYRHLELSSQELNLVKFTQKLQKLKPPAGFRKIDTIVLVPPPIFEVEIILKSSANAKDSIDFNLLSSGEKQMIYSVSSLLYHLSNLDSVRNTKKRKAYRYVNIILEEIELYFHPEMQRNYIRDILISIKRIKLQNIKAVNICFVTHSPFILSDIPACNIMFLNELGKTELDRVPAQTFGGNIHELLGDVFFLREGLIGAFAKEKIQTIIEHLNPDNENLSEAPVYQYSREYIIKCIEMVGEPFLRQMLMEMYYKKYDREKEIKILQARIDQLRRND